MAARDAAHCRPGQIVLHIREERAGDMARLILPPASPFVGQIVAAVEYRPVRIAQVGGQLIRADQGPECHLRTSCKSAFVLLSAMLVPGILSLDQSKDPTGKTSPVGSLDVFYD